jgi:hypothetical protein
VSGITQVHSQHLQPHSVRQFAPLREPSGESSAIGQGAAFARQRRLGREGSEPLSDFVAQARPRPRDGSGALDPQ